MASLGFVRDKRGFLGVGKLLSVGGGMSEVEFFDSPDGPKLRRVSIPTSSLLTIELPTQSRVFLFDDDNQAWRVGRADGLIDKLSLGAAEDHYHVRLPNGGSTRAPISDLFVRSGLAIDNATDYLAARLNETPYFFDGRRRIVRHLAAQRAAFGGLTALASSGIELLEHQVEIARRILADPVQRYLLADEVGLGKTIEAGVVIRQHILDLPDAASVLVVVPDRLWNQWQSEMRQKFFLPPDSAVEVIPFQEVNQFDETDITFLVVDEAHKLALAALAGESAEHAWYEAVRRLSVRIPRVLLLSGTPVLHQEGAFLAMLHLLDPAAYPLDAAEAFRERVRCRQVVAEAMLDLTDEASSFFVNDAVTRLHDEFPQDGRLAALGNSARSLSAESPDSEKRIQSLRALRTYLSENYRLHRRLLRTRRDDPRVRGLLPDRTGTLIIEHQDEARAEAADFLETWRTSLSDSILGGPEVEDVTALFSLWVDAALSHPSVLLRYIDARLALRNGQADVPLPRRTRSLLSLPWAFPEEDDLLRTRKQLLEQAAANDARLLALTNWLGAQRELKRVVVFIDDTLIANEIASALGQRHRAHRIIRHTGQDELPEALNVSDVRAVIVCDSTSEEGLNLQRYGATLVHFDLPLDPMRVEQRIGRIDRLEARGRFRNVVFRAESAYETEWITCLADTIRVFNRSVAPLQYALSDATARLRSRLLSEGAEGIEAVSAELASGPDCLDAELKRIRAQEAIDSLETDAISSRKFFERLTRSDEQIERMGARELESWVVERLQFKREEINPGVVRYSYDVRRPTLLPLKEAAQRFRACIDFDSNPRNARLELPLRPATYARFTAETLGVPLLRVGHPFIEALHEQMRVDDRGTSYVMWRCAPGSLPHDAEPHLFLRFDFVIEADLTPAVHRLAQGTSAETIRRRADAAFPVQHTTVWLDRDLNRVVDKQFLTLLEAPYVKDPRPDGRIDLNVTPERWRAVERSISVSDWRDFCHRSASAAMSIVRNDPALGELRTSSARQLRMNVAAAREIMKSRLAKLEGPAKAAEENSASTEWEIDEALIHGIDSPAIRIDAAGAVILSPRPLDH
ncbi:MAG TPA: protein DpdE [Gemmatimonadaceae bacterium]|nr:protein DpdE [Gemmatimonadaceae bacterium]